jgi:hypothetical protein
MAPLEIIYSADEFKSLLAPAKPLAPFGSKITYGIRLSLRERAIVARVARSQRAFGIKPCILRIVIDRFS